MRIARALTIAAVLALGAFGLARPDTVLAGGLAWLVFLVFALSGWGTIVAQVAGVEEPELGLRAVWGAAGYLAITGVVVAFGMCTRPVILAMIAIGIGGFAWREWTTPRPVALLARDGIAFLRQRPVIAYFAIVLAAAAAIHVLGAVARLDRNPWDDDAAYTPFAKRLLDAGNMIEPFSFRRLASYGGQIALEALAGARGTLANVHLIDQGLCFALVMMLVVGYARELGRVSGLWLGLVGLVLVMLPDISINTASYWSGAALCFGVYRTTVRGRFGLAALIAAAACTLRPTYMPVVALFLAFALGSRLRASARDMGWREAWRLDRSTWAWTLGVALVVLVPWWIAALRSSGTFLFPFVQGTWNHGLSLAPSGWTWLDALTLLLMSCIDTHPIAVVVLLVPLLAFTADDRPTRPLVAWFVASVVGFVLLVHSFPDADTVSLWRYAFGYALPVFLVFVLEVSNDAESSPVRVSALGRGVLLAALLLQLASSRTGLVKMYAVMFHDVRETIAIDGHGDPSARAERKRYQAMQAAVPAGARLIVMVDDPAFLDYHRNSIANLDTPGFASPGTQMPSFTGPEPMRSYLLDQGYRYVAFVRPERSRYLYRREFWLWRVFNDTEFFQAMSAYMIDLSESFTSLAGTQTVIYDRDGLVVLDLGTLHAPAVALDPAGEAERRDAFVRALAAREHFEREWSLSTRRDVAFLDGMTGQTFAPADADRRWYDFAIRDPKPAEGTPIRWIGRRCHLRVRGDREMHLVVRGKVNVEMVWTRPRIDVSLDGELLTSVDVDDHGAFVIDVRVTPPQDWGDLYLVFDTLGDPNRDPKDLRLARLEEVTWQPL